MAPFEHQGCERNADLVEDAELVGLNRFLGQGRHWRIDLAVSHGPQTGKQKILSHHQLQVPQMFQPNLLESLSRGNIGYVFITNTIK